MDEGYVMTHTYIIRGIFYDIFAQAVLILQKLARAYIVNASVYEQLADGNSHRHYYGNPASLFVTYVSSLVLLDYDWPSLV